MGIKYDLAGQTFGFLEVLEKAAPRPAHHGQIAWVCRCVCGEQHEATSRELRSGHTKSCGCRKASMCATANTSHGMAGKKDKAPEYRIWGEMIQRCENPKCNRYHTHGARGIKVCKRWRRSFEAFLKDMGRRPAAGMTIERRDNDGDYTPKNCFWATRTQQARNKQNTVWLEIDGVRKPLVQWAEENGVKATTVRARLKRGWSPKEAVDAG